MSRADRALTAEQAERLGDLIQAALTAAYDAGAVTGNPIATRAHRAAALAAKLQAADAVWARLHALRDAR